MTTALILTDCPTLTLIARGKVRDIYEVPNHPEALLFVATDRVSAFDVGMKNVSSTLLPLTLASC
jgi:phosphoribosylaminoimidazole-succinocarboxamide synthase